MKMSRLAKFTSLAALASALCGVGPDARADYPSTVMSLNPVAYYRLNETNQPPPADSGTNLGSAGALGTLYYIATPTHGAVSLLPGDSATSTYFDPASSQRGATSYGAPYVPPGPFTAEGWFNPSSNRHCGVVCLLCRL